MGVTALPKFRVHTTFYDNKFKISANPSFPYSCIDVNPKLGRVVLLIVGRNDYAEITKSKSNLAFASLLFAFQYGFFLIPMKCHYFRSNARRRVS